MSISFFLLNTLYTANAQLIQNERLEIYLSRNEDNFEVLSAKNSGLVLYRNLSSQSSSIQITHIDTAFKQKWSGTVEVEKKFKIGKALANEQNAYFLLHHRDFTDITFHLYKINLDAGSLTRFTVHNYIPFQPTTFEVTNQGALIGGYFIGRIPVILFFDFDTMKSKVLPGLFNETGELIQTQINFDDSFNILIGAKNYLKQKTIWIKSYTAQGDLLQNHMLKPEYGSGLLFGRIVSLNDNDDQLIAGVYSNRNSDYSRGLFLARVNSGGYQELKYYAFADLDNFFKYMKAKREKRVKDRIARKKIKGKKLKFQYRFLVHELVEHDNEYVLLGEAFYPKYKQPDRSFAFNSFSGQQAIFDGYQYTHAVIIGFNHNGALLWDNSFEINDVRTFTLEQFVKMDVQSDKIVLLYLFDNKIRTKIIQDDLVLEGKAFNQLQMRVDEFISDDSDKISKLDYWYNKNFLAYGTQNVSNRFGKNSRRMFFINKISYR